MLLTGKKLLLAILVLNFLTEIVNACSYGSEFREKAKIAERGFDAKIYFYSTIFLILANVVLFFVRNKKDWWLLTTIVSLVLISIPVTFVTAYVDSRGGIFVPGLKISFVVLLLFFIFQTCFGINRTSMQIKGGTGGKMTTIDLR